MSFWQHKQHTWVNLIWQPLCAMVFLCCVLFVLNVFSTSPILWAVGAGSLASSCYVVFGKPQSSAAIPQRMIGGYLVGIVTGVGIRYLAIHFDLFHGFVLGEPHMQAVGLLAAISVGLALILMILLQFEHPPAAGMTLVLVLEVRDYRTVTIVFVAAVILALLHFLLRPYLRDLT